MSDSSQGTDPEIIADVQTLVRELQMLGKSCKPLKKAEQNAEPTDGNTIVVKGR